MNTFVDYYARIPPDERRLEALDQVRRIATRLMVGILAAERPSLGDSTWVSNAPCGPSFQGREILEKIQKRYGACHVTTGNARPPTREEIGVYVRTDVLRRSGNFLADHLSRKR